jgi:hypothetical protein
VECPLLALSGHIFLRRTCLLLTQSGYLDRPMIVICMRRPIYEQPIAMRAPLTSSPTIQRNEKNRRALHPFYIAAVAAVLIMQAPNAHAQHGSAPAGPSEKEKAKAQEKRIFEKDTDEAYKSTLGRIPDAKQPKVDPWGSMRTAPQK